MTKALFLAQNLKPGEHYAGILLGVNGEPDHHIILLPGEHDGLKWVDAVKWAAKAGGKLPTRREQRVLFANAKAQFKPEWYWSEEQHADYSGCAWVQDFYGGVQYYDRKSGTYRARAVRRLTIL